MGNDKTSVQCACVFCLGCADSRPRVQVVQVHHPSLLTGDGGGPSSEPTHALQAYKRQDPQVKHTRPLAFARDTVADHCKSTNTRTYKRNRHGRWLFPGARLPTVASLQAPGPTSETHKAAGLSQGQGCRSLQAYKHQDPQTKQASRWPGRAADQNNPII